MAQWSCKRRDICVQLSHPFRDVIGAIFRDEQSDFGLIALGVNGDLARICAGSAKWVRRARLKQACRLRVRFVCTLLFPCEAIVHGVRPFALRFFFNAMMRAARI